MPFDSSDVVPLNFRTTVAGGYSIAIDHLLGLFEESQAIYLRYNLTNIVHDLKTVAYDFASEAVVFNNRFELVYENLLAVAQPEYRPIQ